MKVSRNILAGAALIAGLMQFAATGEAQERQNSYGYGLC